MTATKFYEILSEAGNRMVWDINERNYIRGRFRRARVKRNFCPITAVMYLENRKYVDASFALDAAEHMGLNENFAHKITTSADNVGSKKVRRHIKRVLNLS